jgi:hypothetical protein
MAEVEKAAGSGEVGLASALEALREELEEAWLKSRSSRVRFRASEITLTVQTVARRDREGGGRLRWWVLEAGAEVKTGLEQTQTMTLTLTPQLYDEHGDALPLDVAGHQRQPGQ